MEWDRDKKETSPGAYGGQVKGRTESGKEMGTRLLVSNRNMESEAEREGESDPDYVSRYRVDRWGSQWGDVRTTGVGTGRMRMRQPRELVLKQ